MVAVHNRYEENASLLRIQRHGERPHDENGRRATCYGSKDNYSGNLVPFGSQVVYEENPTISYTPVAGAKYLREVMTPVPLATLAQFSSTLIDPAPGSRLVLPVSLDAQGTEQSDITLTTRSIIDLVEILTAAIEVAYRGGWFYIDERDQATKRFFRLLTTLWRIAMAENTNSSGAPVLTVPASR